MPWGAAVLPLPAAQAQAISTVIMSRATGRQVDARGTHLARDE